MERKKKLNDSFRGMEGLWHVVMQAICSFGNHLVCFAYFLQQKKQDICDAAEKNVMVHWLTS
jgi:hypothetical protein